MAKHVTAVFDIGKTNKKFFVFDEDFNEVHREYIRFDEIPDDDGFMGEDLDALVKWVKDAYSRIKDNPEFKVKALNFSTYGASLVHLDESGNRVTPFYNYLKPFPEELSKKFFSEHGAKEQFELETASPFMGFLNSGLQLYYLKYAKPELFAQVRKSVHFPQYLSGLITDEFESDYTSLGCHTGLWDASNNDYAKWVKAEKIEPLLCPVVTSKTYHTREGVKVGVGIHDSSSALVPYINTNVDPFVLISTGTWSICLNMSNHKALTDTELNADCLNFMSIKGLSVKASRLFLGKHLSNMAKVLSDHYQVDYQSYKSLPKKPDFVSKRTSSKQLLLDHTLIQPERFGFTNGSNDFSTFEGYEEALYHLFDELTDLQIASLQLAIGSTDVKKIYVDGGFSSSEVFIQMLTNKLPEYEIYSSDFSLGSSLGAAITVNHRNLPEHFLEKIYKVKLHKPE
jgi:sugar (pentulose or hexulose) kinase